MALDLVDADGELDMGKVNGYLAVYMARLQPPPFPSSVVGVSSEILKLIDEAANQSYGNGVHDAMKALGG